MWLIKISKRHRREPTLLITCMYHISHSAVDILVTNMRDMSGKCEVPTKKTQYLYFQRML